MSHALAEWDSDKTLYLFTSLTAGSSHIITATSRIETILRANRLHFTYIDTATNESARKLYGRRGRGKKLPLLVKQGEILGDLNEIEEFNEFGELKQVVGELPPPTEKSVVAPPAKMLGPYSAKSAASNKPVGGVAAAASAVAAAAAAKASSSSGAAGPAGSTPASTASASLGKENEQAQMPMRGLAAEVAAKAQEKKRKEVEAIKASLQADQKAAGDAPASETAVADSEPPSRQLSPSTSGADAAQSMDTVSAAPVGLSGPAEQASPEIRTHRGSSLSMASEEEIKEIEKECAIPEEDEEEDNKAEAKDLKKEEKELSMPISGPGEEQPDATTTAANDAATETAEDTTTTAATKVVDDSEPPVDEAHETTTAGKAKDDENAIDAPAVADATKQDAEGVTQQAEAPDDVDPPAVGKKPEAPDAEAAPESSQTETSQSKPDAAASPSNEQSEANGVDAMAVKATEPSSAVTDSDPAETAKAEGDNTAERTQEQAAAKSEDATKSVED